MRPLRLRLPTATAWAKSGAWTPASLGAHLSGTRLTVKRSVENPWFMYTASGQEAELLADQTPPTDTCSISARDFLDALTDGPPYLYYTSHVAEHAALPALVPGWEALAADSAYLHAAAPILACEPWMQWWVGSGGATTQAHYDVADNLFVQLHGRKEFWLFPPDAALCLHVYPDAHPRARKSQVCLERPDAARHPMVAALPEPLRVVLEPGDALAIPAFWFHHVVARSASVSVNIFSESAVKLAAAEPLGLALPLHATWPDALKRDGLTLLVGRLLRLLQLREDSISISEARSQSQSRLREDSISISEARSGQPTARGCGDGRRRAAWDARLLLRQHVASRFQPLRQKDALGGAGTPRTAEGVPQHGSPPTAVSAPSVAGRRRRRAAPAPSSFSELVPSLEEHAALCAESFDRLRLAALRVGHAHRERWHDAAAAAAAASSVDAPAAAPHSRGWDVLDDEAADDAYWAGVRDLTIMHLVELWAFRLFGAERLDDELSRLAEHVADSMARGGPG